LWFPLTLATNNQPTTFSNLKTMKFIKSILAMVLMLIVSLSANAQRGLDTFAAPRTVSFGIQTFTPNSNSVTNGPVDIRMFDGVAKINFFNATNSNTTGGTLTATVYGSSDATNMTAITYALGVNRTVNYTNNFWGTSTPIGTNNWILPGTMTTPTASTSGFASQYLSPAPFTNTAAINVASRGCYEIGFNAGDAPRYIFIVWTTGGSVTNFTGGAIMTGFTHDTLTQ
jgi:hypothetical protein